MKDKLLSFLIYITTQFTVILITTIISLIMLYLIIPDILIFKNWNKYNKIFFIGIFIGCLIPYIQNFVSYIKVRIALWVK